MSIGKNLTLAVLLFLIGVAIILGSLVVSRITSNEKYRTDSEASAPNLPANSGGAVTQTSPGNPVTGTGDVGLFAAGGGGANAQSCGGRVLDYSQICQFMNGTGTFGYGYNKVTIQCNGTAKPFVLNGCRTAAKWKKLTEFYCNIPCRGVGNGDSCAQYPVEQCSGPRGVEGMDCGYYWCANKCLTKESPMDLVCPPAPTNTPTPERVEQDSQNNSLVNPNTPVNQQTP